MDFGASGCIKLLAKITEITADSVKAGDDVSEKAEDIKTISYEVQAGIVSLERLIRISATSTEAVSQAKIAISHTEITLKRTASATDRWLRRTKFHWKKGFNPRLFLKHARTLSLRVAYSTMKRAAVLDKEIGRLKECRDHIHGVIRLFPYQLSDAICSLSPHVATAWKSICDVEEPKFSTIPLIVRGETAAVPLTNSPDIRFYKPDGLTGHLLVRQFDTDDRKLQSVHLFHMLKNVPVSLEPSPNSRLIPTGLLQCVGTSETYRQSNWTRFRDLVFAIPEAEFGRNPRTLRDILAKGDMKLHSLSDRVRFARTLVTSVVVLHSLGIVHNRIRPECIIVFEEPQKSTCNGMTKLGTPYLIGFDQSCQDKPRPSDNEVELDEEADLYVHPDRFSNNRKAFQMCDDRYSLGVCLIEIALWCGAFGCDSESEGEDEGDIPEPVGRFAFLGREKIASALPVRNGIYDDALREEYRDILQRFGPAKGVRTIAAVRKELLLEFARNEIPQVMGDGFLDIVLECLSSESDVERMAMLETEAEAGVGNVGQETNEVDETVKESDANSTAETKDSEGSVGVPSCSELVHQSTSVFSGVKDSFVDASSNIINVMKSVMTCSSSSSIDPSDVFDGVVNVVQAVCKVVKFDEGGEDEDELLDLDSVLTDLLQKKKISQSTIRSIHAIRSILRKLECIKVDLPLARDAESEGLTNDINGAQATMINVELCTTGVEGYLGLETDSGTHDDPGED